MAETSITIPDVTAVVDTLRCKETGYDASRSLPCLKEGVDQAGRREAKERSGGPRAARKVLPAVPAVVLRFFREHTTPEIHRVGLDGLCLQVLSMDLDVDDLCSSLLGSSFT